MAGTDSGLKTDLSKHTDKYAPSCLKLSISKKINFIFGKNGTGKTTIADELASQFSGMYSVHVFKDFDGVAVNERLDAVALGTKNAKIQKQMDALDDKIAIIAKEVESPEDDTENLFTKAASARKSLDKQQKKIEDFSIKSAQQIKNQSNPSIASTSYDKNGFKNEIFKAKTLTDEEVAANKDTIRADKKPDIAPVTLPVIDLVTYLESTNKILEARVKQPVAIPELSNNAHKQQFAKTGFDIHEHKTDEICAFCGNEISEERWIALGNYFNSEVKTLELCIETGITEIKEELRKISTVQDIDLHAYYGKYARQIKQLNTNIKLRKAEYRACLEKLNKALTEKKTNLFAKTNPIKLDIPEDFSIVQKEYTKLINNNNSFSKNLTSEQSKSKDALRYHEIQKKLDAFKYTKENTTLSTLSGLNDATADSLRAKKDELTRKHEERTDLISKTKDEKKIAIKINELLKSMGVASFELDLVKDEDENQKGQYQIKGHDGSMRQITALSKGEKNIIAFLYFIFDLERTDGNNKPKIVVLDDPMTSNDDTMQYVMIGEIQKFYRNLQDGDYFILLTHNVHFYLNARPNTSIKYKVDGEEISFYEKFGVYHLFSDGKHSTTQRITEGKNDFKTSYETLWKELVFLHGATDATSDLMLNPCRKICETYMNFTKKGIETFYGNNTNAKKLFDVNQHSIDDLEAEQNGKTKDEIKDILKGLFGQNGAEEHFNSYWKEN
jgi:wobble nucleotide-excising tRNase